MGKPPFLTKSSSYMPRLSPSMLKAISKVALLHATSSMGTPSMKMLQMSPLKNMSKPIGVGILAFYGLVEKAEHTLG